MEQVDAELRDFVLKYPSLLSCLDVYGLERAALGFELMLAGLSNEPNETNRPQIPDEELFGIERAARGFTKMLAAVRRDSHGHFYTPDGAACPHSTGKTNKKSKPQKQPKEYKLPAGFKHVAVKKVYERIGNGKSETVIAADGKPARFSKMGINHFKKKDVFERICRLQSLDVAQDTVKTGLHFDSLIPNTDIPQTEFIKDYGGEFFYTARRKDTGDVYSWHKLRPTRFAQKMKEYRESLSKQKQTVSEETVPKKNA